MKILQVTNIVSHHQLPLARELCSLVGADNFRFAAMHGLDQSRFESGWKSDYPERWIIRPGENDADLAEFENFWINADVVLCGERLIGKMLERVANKKLCFYMSERWWKPPIWALRLLQPSFLKMAFQFRMLSKNEYFHYLPTGPFAARDIALFTSMGKRTWRWGYFTDTPGVNRRSILYEQHEEPSTPLKVLWIGRMLGWKRVDLLIKAISKINGGKKRVHLTLVGNGPERQKLEKLAANLLETADFTFTEVIPSSEVPEIMMQHDIYVLPSSSYEGWGAVVNEALSVGCAVIASDKTGAGQAMITDGHNGLLFRSGSVSDLTRCLRTLLENHQTRIKISEQAIREYSEHWSPSVAARKFLEVSEDLLLSGNGTRFSKGPMGSL
ncbi:glycosyltransferase family 4 protein [Cycloclasticus pugetii]|uniref:glycosyltransferase family 4 protein n=1 Tax=Cycloclasticus pugetii TaxID=34068 RepID=UPI003A95172C